MRHRHCFNDGFHLIARSGALHRHMRAISIAHCSSPDQSDLQLAAGARQYMFGC